MCSKEELPLANMLSVQGSQPTDFFWRLFKIVCGQFRLKWVYASVRLAQILKFICIFLIL
jgi:hypothetical protein